MNMATPRNVRNFWLVIEVDGRKTKVCLGPKNKNGGFSAQVFMRDNGESKCMGQLVGKSINENTLDLDWHTADSDEDDACLARTGR